MRAVFNYANDHYRDDEGKKLLPDSPFSVLSTKRQWHNVQRKNTRIRNNELARWLAAVKAIREDALIMGNDVRAATCDALDFALFTGLRRSEVFQLTWNRIKLSAGYFWISETKNGDELELPITGTLAKILKRRWSVKGSNDFVFPGRGQRTGLKA